MTTLRQLLRAGSKLEGAAAELEDIIPTPELASRIYELQNDLRLVRLTVAALIERERKLPE